MAEAVVVSLCGILGSLVLAGCSASVRVAFRTTDASFRPSPRASEPKVYLQRDEVPQVALRSVGIIEVTAAASESAEVTIKASAKGKELGCWALVDHSLFDEMQRGSQTRGGTQSSGFSGTNALLAHGGMDHGRVQVSKPANPLVTLFDCVMKVEDKPRATPIVI